MSALYNVCLALINKGRTDGLQAKLDIFFAAGRLSQEEYTDLVGRLEV